MLFTANLPPKVQGPYAQDKRIAEILLHKYAQEQAGHLYTLGS